MKFDNSNSHTTGIIMAVVAYGLWGILPIYWKLLQSVNPLEILAHRIIWCLFFLWLLLLISKGVKDAINEAERVFRHPAKIAGVALAAAALTINWYTYIWAVNNNHVIQASLGYYINPLISVLLGVIILKEKLSIYQKVACLLALFGVMALTINYGSIPWVALALAISFAFYGLLKKMINIEPITGLILESCIMSLFSLVYLFNLHNHGQGVFGGIQLSVTLLLIGAGVVTSLPLILFSRAVNHLPLSLMGFLQYINPTFSLLLGIFIFKENFSLVHLAAFSLIWTGLLIFSLANGRNANPV